MPSSDDDLGEWWLHQRRRFDQASRPLFDSLLLLVAWSVSKEKNCRVFGRPASSVQTVVQAAVKEGEDWAMARVRAVISVSSPLVAKLSCNVTPSCESSS